MYINITKISNFKLIFRGTSFNPKEPQGTPRILKIHPNQSFINCKLVYMHFSLDMNTFSNNLNLSLSFFLEGGGVVVSQTEGII